MKTFTLISLLTLSLVGLNSCKKDTTDEIILINLINKTGANIQSVIVDNVQVGNITDNGQTGFISFEKFGTDTQMPDCNFMGLQNNDTLKSTSYFYFCGTEKSQLKPGKYNIEIGLYTTPTEKYFDLKFR